MKRIIVFAFLLTVLNSSIYAQLFKTNQTIKIPNSKTLISFDDGRMENCKYVIDSICPTILIFWLSSNDESLKYLDVLNSKIAEWKKQVEFRAIAISNDKKNYKINARSIAEKNKYKFDFFFDDEDELKKVVLADWQGIPQVFVFDNKSKVLLHVYGCDVDDPTKIIDVIKKFYKK